MKNRPDLPDLISDAGAPADPPIRNQNPEDNPTHGAPKVPTPDSTPEEIDRSSIIGHDARVAAGWALRFIIVVAATYIAAKILGWLWVGVVPVILALIAATVLWPMVRFLRNYKVPGALAALLSLVVFFSVIGGIFAAMTPMVRNQGGEIVDRAVAGITTILQWLQGPPLSLDLNVDNLNVDQALTGIIDFLTSQSQNIISGVSSGISVAASIGTTLFIMLVVTFFILKDGEGFLPMIRRYAGSRAGWHLSEVLTRSWNTLSGYIQTQALVSFVDAFFIGIGLVILQVPMALVLAVITFFAGFIPIVGAFTAGALAVVIALVTNGLTNALLVLALILVVQQLEGNILQPALQSKAMDLHAAIVLLAVTVGSALFGILGAFLAVPFAAVAGVWVRYHSEMVALRAGEITVDDIQLATAQGQTPSSREAFVAVRDQFKAIGIRKNPAGGSTAASKSADPEIAREVTDHNVVDQPEDIDVKTPEER